MKYMKLYCPTHSNNDRGYYNNNNNNRNHHHHHHHHHQHHHGYDKYLNPTRRPRLINWMHQHEKNHIDPHQHAQTRSPTRSAERTSEHLHKIHVSDENTHHPGSQARTTLDHLVCRQIPMIHVSSRYNAYVYMGEDEWTSYDQECLGRFRCSSLGYRMPAESDTQTQKVPARNTNT